MYFLDREEIHTFLINGTWKEEAKDAGEGPIAVSQS